MGKTERQADRELIAELRRTTEWVAFDELPLPDLSADDLDLASIKALFHELTQRSAREDPDHWDHRLQDLYRYPQDQRGRQETVHLLREDIRSTSSMCRCAPFSAILIISGEGSRPHSLLTLLAL